MAIFTGSIKGVKETVIAFQKLDSDKTNSFVVAASEEAANVIMKKAQRFVPVDTGQLKISLQVKQVKVRSKKYSRTFLDVPIFTVGPKYVTRRGPSGISSNYGHLVELGHKTINGKKIKAQPYLRPAADGSKETVINLVVDAMNKALDEFGRD